MSNFVLRLNKSSGRYEVYENGMKVKNDIFAGVDDFERELKWLGFNQPYTIIIN